MGVEDPSGGEESGGGLEVEAVRRKLAALFPGAPLGERLTAEAVADADALRAAVGVASSVAASWRASRSAAAAAAPRSNPVTAPAASPAEAGSSAWLPSFARLFVETASDEF